jgi:hypothetical protein
MNCKKCKASYESGARFCKNCGIDLTILPSEKITNPRLTDTLLLLFIAIIAILSIIEITAGDYYTDLQRIISLVVKFASMLVALAMRNKSLKAIGIIIVSLINFVYLAYCFLIVWSRAF